MNLRCLYAREFRAKDRSGNRNRKGFDWERRAWSFLNSANELEGFDAPKEREKTKIGLEKFLYYFG